MARARGSYPRCRWFKSSSRYYEKGSFCGASFCVMSIYYSMKMLKQPIASKFSSCVPFEYTPSFRLPPNKTYAIPQRYDKISLDYDKMEEFL